MIDASHDNSGKDPERQPAVVAEVGAQLRARERPSRSSLLKTVDWGSTR
jgi:3-deoxy-7-phosphoheptulonate synthase